MMQDGSEHIGHLVVGTGRVRSPCRELMWKKADETIEGYISAAERRSKCCRIVTVSASPRPTWRGMPSRWPTHRCHSRCCSASYGAMRRAHTSCRSRKGDAERGLLGSTAMEGAVLPTNHLKAALDAHSSQKPSKVEIDETYHKERLPRASEIFWVSLGTDAVPLDPARFGVRLDGATGRQDVLRCATALQHSFHALQAEEEHFTVVEDEGHHKQSRARGESINCTRAQEMAI
ncbi:hypothetical protein F4801DRAFT_150394 [Xylaria longipes]|nr:hypothetical protein F4801DRAFT_150394 [Xylaria longipes]